VRRAGAAGERRIPLAPDLAAGRCGGKREDTGREAEARAPLANRVLQMEATVGQHSEAICRLLLVTAPLKERGERELPSMEESP
jgi:hypothetical protein